VVGAQEVSVEVRDEAPWEIHSVRYSLDIGPSVRSLDLMLPVAVMTCCELTVDLDGLINLSSLSASMWCYRETVGTKC
jgi:hypothetical protein